jgi:TRAP-type uncharacterized transport system substrate-binding protein
MTIPRNQGEAPRPKVSLRRASWFALGVGGIALALGIALHEPERSSRPLTLTAGPAGTSRAWVAGELATAAAAHGLVLRVVEATDTDDELRQVEAGAIDLALVSGAYTTPQHQHVREVTPLYVEALHLLVRKELWPGVALGGFDFLRGRRVAVGAAGSANAALARSALAFAGLQPRSEAGGGDFDAIEVDAAEVWARFARGERAALPDAIFVLATVPSLRAAPLLRDAEFALVPLPFAKAFRLSWLGSDHTGPDDPIDRNAVVDSVIPPYTYGVAPPTPAEALHTLGTQLLLVAHDGVPRDSVELLLEAIFHSRFARGVYPTLEQPSLTTPTRLRHHLGTRDFLARYQPFVTGEKIDELNNSLSIVGAVAGSLLFFWQWRRQRRQEALDEAVGHYLIRVAGIERRMAAQELSATLELEPLVALRREVIELKSEVLERFTGGELGGYATMAGLLVPINAARDQIGELILHVRENLEQRADAEGRSAGALWSEAMGSSSAGEPAGAGPGETGVTPPREA